MEIVALMEKDGVTCKPLPLADIPRHVFPASVQVSEKETVTRPAEWV